jgi:hypothetical protein
VTAVFHLLRYHINFCGVLQAEIDLEIYWEDKINEDELVAARKMLLTRSGEYKDFGLLRCDAV